MNDDEPKTSGFETLLKYRLPRGTVQQMKEFLWLITFMLGLGLGFAALAGLEWWTCGIKDPNITFMQCIRHENLGKKK